MAITFPDEACAVTGTAHEKHIYCWNGNSKTKNKWKTFATTLLPF